jgi:hypothetical protein
MISCEINCPGDGPDAWWLLLLHSFVMIAADLDADSGMIRQLPSSNWRTSWMTRGSSTPVGATQQSIITGATPGSRVYRIKGNTTRAPIRPVTCAWEIDVVKML